MSYLKIPALIVLMALYGCGGSDVEKARKFIENGQKHLSENNMVAAKIEFTNALRLDKNSIEALYQLALFAESDKNWQQLESYLKNLLSLNPEHIDARLKLTHFYMGSNQTSAAKIHSDYLLKIAPENTDVRLVQAAVLYKLEETDAARKLVEDILLSHPDSVDAIFLRANDFMQDSKLEDAIALLDKGIASHPDNLALNMSKIQALNAFGDWEGTIPVYRHLMELHPSSAAPAASLAQTFANNGQIELAITTIESFAKTNNNANFYIKAVELVAATKGLEQSEANLKRYIKSNPALSELRFALSDIYSQTNRIDLAYSEVQQIKKDASDITVKLQAMNRLARMDFSTGKEAKAKKTIEAILKESPEDVGALTLKSNLLIKDNKAEDAIKILRGALRKNSESAELLLTLGRAHEQEQQWELANENYANSLKLSQGKPAQTIYYAEFLVRRGNIDKAESLLEPLILSGIKNSKALTIFTQIMLSKKNWAKALETVELLKAETGDAPEVALMQGLAHEGQNNTKLAIASFKHLYELTPDSPKSQDLLVKAYIEANQRNEAEKIIAELLKKDSKNFNALMLQGNVYADYKEWPKAISAIEKAISAEPKQFQGHDRLIKIFMQTEQVDKAIEAIEKGLREFPENVTLSVYKASIYQKMKQPKKSIDIYQTILDKNPALDIIANNLAVLLQNLGGEENLKRAAEVANRFRQTKIPQYQDTLGWIYTQLGNTEEAEALLRRAADKLPDIAEVQYHLGIVFHRAKKLDSAKKQLEIALKLAKEQKISADWVNDAASTLKSLGR